MHKTFFKTKTKKKNKNTIAKFSKEIKAEILIRDKSCIIKDCDNGIQDYHHAYYWAIHANLWPNRNDVDQWVWLCAACHANIHHFSNNWKSQELREYCMNYLQNYYK